MEPDYGGLGNAATADPGYGQFMKAERERQFGNAGAMFSEAVRDNNPVEPRLVQLRELIAQGNGALDRVLGSSKGPLATPSIVEHMRHLVLRIQTLTAMVDQAL